jgi:hypothetical protein
VTSLSDEASAAEAAARHARVRRHVPARRVALPENRSTITRDVSATKDKERRIPDDLVRIG